MTNPIPKPPYVLSDGTSQAERLQAALEPEYVSIDERSPGDLLKFAKEFARELKIFR